MQTEDQRRASRAVEAQLAKDGHSNAWLARTAAVDQGTIGAFVSGLRWPQRATLAKVEAALGWEVGIISAIAEGRTPAGVPDVPEPAEQSPPPADDEEGVAWQREIVRIIGDTIRARGFPRDELAWRAGMPLERLDDILTGRANMEVLELIAISRSLDLHPFTVGSIAGDHLK